MELPLILINFKTYKETTGDKAIKIAKICDKISAKYKKTIGIAPQYFDLKEIRSQVKIPIFAQHIDAFDPGAHTGHIVAENLKEIGIVGSLINHSEIKLNLEDIEKRIEIMKKNNLISICCVAEPNEAKLVAKFNPDFIAIEPPELIGSGVSVSTSKPEIVTNSIKEIQSANKKIKVLCGAGITNGDDVKKALELGTFGVLVASGVVKAKDPESVLIDFCKKIT